MKPPSGAWGLLLWSAQRIAVETASAGCVVPQKPRRLSDKLLIAFHHACDQGHFEVAEQLLPILEKTLPPDGNRRRNMDGLVAAHERLWILRHPGERSGKRDGGAGT